MAYYAHLTGPYVDIAPGVTGRLVVGVYRFFDGDNGESGQEIYGPDPTDANPADVAKSIAIITAWQNSAKEQPIPNFSEGDGWQKTSYNNKISVRFARKGGYYSPELNAFTTACGYKTWIFNPQTVDYDPPTPKPADNKAAIWSDEQTKWVTP